MDSEKLKDILAKHKLWLDGKSGGERANLQGANLQEANLQGADLQGAYLQRANLQGANLQEANLQEANLQGADLQEAYLQGADLQGAYLDFSCWPLWCGSKGVKVDIKLVWQLLAHVACLKCGNPEYEKIKKAILPYARKSHRADDLGITRPRREEG
jgi:hypothetical protein